MKGPIKVAKVGYNRVLKIDDLIVGQRQTNDILQCLMSSVEDLRRQNEELRLALSDEKKKNELRFAALYKKTGEDENAINKRFLENLPAASGDLRIFQLGNNKILSAFIALCKKHKLKYFLQSGTLLGAVRHHGFVPWDDDTDVAMFRDDIKKLREILKDNKEYRLVLVYDYYVKSRQLRFRTTDPENPCFLDVYIYDYGNDESDAAWQQWHETKDKICDKFEKYDRALTEEWSKNPYPEEDSPLGKKLRPVYEKFYDPLVDTKINSENYTTINWGLDNFGVKWKRLFKKEMIFPTVDLSFEGITVAAPREYDAYLYRQYGNIYSLPKDLVSHFQHIDKSKINVGAIKDFLEK